MTKRPLGSSAGFTYIAALVMVVIVGIMASQAAEVWSTKMKREREVELLFRGTQVRDALRRWYKIKAPAAGAAVKAAAVQMVGPSPKDLKDLLNGTNSAAKVHYLRPSNLVDPITLKEWALIKGADGRITGVASTSDAEPLKQANFPFDLKPEDFEKKKKYSEWQFICINFPTPGSVGGGVTGLGGSTSPGGSSAGTGSNPGSSPTKTGP